MRSNTAFQTQPARTSGAARPAEAPFYPDDLMSELQSALATLADLEVQFEIARDSLEDWCGFEEDRQRCCAELEHAHRQAREAHLQRLAELEDRIRGVRVSHSRPPFRHAA